ncbi:MAG: T9SS type A sorting domain-containing protein [Candidatus Marinimicrobia bacterium]|nr:T9SS type A sorting domain-containing protein [Candidatus Neomarinimicrobiota bacterium]
MIFIVGEDAGGPVVEITRLPEGSRLLGFNGDSWVYELGDSLWLRDQRIAILTDGIPPIIISEHDALSSPGEGFWGLTLMNPGYLAQRYLPNGSPEFPIEDTVLVATIGIVPWVHPQFDEGKLTIWVEHFPVPPPPDSSRIRYLPSPLSLIDPYPYWVSAGDIDGDGNDEQVEIDMQAPSTLTVRNDNSIALDGFPVEGDFRGVVLIANLTGDIRPELLVIESGDIAIYSPEGREQLRLGLQAGPEELFLMHTADGRVGLANGDRIHWFEPEEPNPQWVTPQGRHSRNRVSLNDGQVKVPQPAVLDRARVYNYPNPVTGGRTTIRFYTGSATRANIRIFTVEGLPVQEVTLTDLATNDYNEWVWQVGDNPSGLYYAVVEVVGAQTESVLVKIAVVK